MMARRGALGLLVAVAALFVGGCGRRGKALRFKLTVEVNTPAGLKTGASVLESVFNSGNGFENSASAWTYGEAPTVDLGNGRYLFALLDNPLSNNNHTMYAILFDVLQYSDLEPPLNRDVSLFDQANETKPLGVVQRKNYPLLVTFGDIGNPKTVSEVKPDTMSSTFGAGYAINRITIQVVDNDEPLTTGIEERFNWAVDGNVNLNGESFSFGTADEKTLAQKLNATNFRWRKK